MPEQKRQHNGTHSPPGQPADNGNGVGWNNYENSFGRDAVSGLTGTVYLWPDRGPDGHVDRHLAGAEDSRKDVSLQVATLIKQIRVKRKKIAENV